MALPSDTFTTYDSVGNREDLQDKVYMVSPEKTPVMSAGRRFKATAKFHEWQRDSLATPNKDNAVIEGDDRTGTALTATERVGNYATAWTIINGPDKARINAANAAFGKGGAESLHSAMNRLALAQPKLAECAAVGQFPDDAIVRRNAGLIGRIEKDVDGLRQLQLITLGRR